MNPRLYERLYGMRARLLAWSVALTLLITALLFRTSRDQQVKPSEVSPPSDAVAQAQHPPAEPPAMPITETVSPRPAVAVAPAVSSPVPVEPEASGKEVSTAESLTYRVRQGDCVWWIAEIHCGSGFKWGEVYRANLDRIANPDLIYPDQDLTIPCRQ